MPDLVQCPLCGGRGKNDPKVPDEVTVVFIEFAHLFNGVVETIQCTLCYGRGWVIKELASAFFLTIADSMRRIDIFKIRRVIMPRSSPK